MGIEAFLLGPPLLRRDGVVYAAPRGKKVWALFAYLALAEQAPTRQLLAEMLFPDAEDPANALRWNLSELRRLLGGPETVGSGRVVALRLPHDAVIDVRVLLEGSAEKAVALPGLGRELLEGVDVEASPGFDAWLLGERRQLQAVAGAVLREGALEALAAGEARAAVELATRLVGAEPLSEDAHVLLVRAFAATGDEVAVERQLAASLELFRHELGIDLGNELYAAARMAPSAAAVPAAAPADAFVSAAALRESGEAAVDAGAIAVGLEELHAAVEASAGTPAFEAETMLSLGSALVHAAHGRDEDGAAMLHRAIAVAESVGDRRTSAAAHRELGYVELLRGDYARTSVWLARAIELADGDELEVSRIRSVAAGSLADRGRHAQAEIEFAASIDLAERVQHGRQRAWAETLRGRSYLLCGQLDAAEETLDQALDRTRAERWTAFQPFPESLLAEVRLRAGRHDVATESLEHAFTLSCSVDDACWEAYAVRGLGLLEAARGDLPGAIKLMEDAQVRCRRQRDTHGWIHAYVLDALCAVAVADDHPNAAAWVGDLASYAGSTGMREFAVRAYLYMSALGDGDALEAARMLAVEVENPALAAALAAGVSPGLEDLLGTPA